MALSKIQSESIDLADNFAGMRFGGTASDNALNDFEEGTYTATATPHSGGTITLNSSKDTLAYTKIGRLVHVSGRLTVSSVSGQSGQIRINLPFTVASLTEDSDYFTGTFLPNNLASGDNIADYVVIGVGGESRFRVYVGDSNDTTETAAANVQANSEFYVSVSFLAA